MRQRSHSVYEGVAFVDPESGTRVFGGVVERRVRAAAALDVSVFDG